MRSKKVVKNGIYAAGSFIILSLLGIVVRTVFVKYVDISLLGYEGLFGNVFSILLLADLGVETLINFKLYPAVENDDKTAIIKYLCMYKRLYAIVGIIMFVAGIIAIPLLPHIIKDEITNWNYVIIIYLLQLISTVSTYFLAYKRVIFIVYQKEYKNTQIDFYGNLINSILKIIALVIFESYIIYLICNLLTNIFRNIIISWRVNNEYPFLREKRDVSFEEIKEEGIFTELKNGIYGKVAATIYFGVDNILVSKFIGLAQVGMMANYTLIMSSVDAIISKFVNPLQPSVGSYVYSHSKEDGLQLFKMFDTLFFILALFVSGSFVALFNPFITVWLGEKYVLSQLYVLAIALNEYISWNHRGVCIFRYCFANYALEKKASFTAAIINLVISILLIKPFGIAGVAIGTAVGNVGFWIGRIKALYTEYIEENVFIYIRKQTLNIAVLIASLLCMNYISSALPYTIIGIVERMIICVVIPMVIGALALLFSGTYKTAKIYIDVLKGGRNIDNMQ